MKPAKIDLRYNFELESKTSISTEGGFAHTVHHVRLMKEGNSSHESLGIEFDFKIKPDGSLNEKRANTSAEKLRSEFQFFSEFVDGLDAEQPVSMDGQCAFQFDIKTKNLPAGMWRSAARHTTHRGLMRGSMPLFELYPRLFAIQQFCGLKTEPTAKLRATLHAMNDGKSLGRIVQLGNTHQELFDGLFAKMDADRFDKVNKGVSYAATIHGYECKRSEAFYRSVTAKSLRNTCAALFN